MRTLSLTVACLVAACASAEQVRGPDGTMNWYSIDCRRSQSYCEEKAGEVCPQGYDVANSSGHTGTFVQVTQFGGTATPTYNGHLMIRCKTNTETVETDSRPKAIAVVQSQPRTVEGCISRIGIESHPESARVYLRGDSEISFSPMPKVTGATRVTMTTPDNITFNWANVPKVRTIWLRVIWGGEGTEVESEPVEVTRCESARLVFAKEQPPVKEPVQSP